MPSYKVLDCKFKKNYEGRRLYAIYSLKLDDGTKPDAIEAELLQPPPPEAPEPQKGEQWEGVLEPSDYGWKFKKARKLGSDGKPQDNGSGKDEPYRKHPAEVAAVQRAHAQEMALRQLAIREQFGELQNTTAQQRETLLIKLIDWFEADVNKAMELAELPPAEVADARNQLRDQASRLADAGTRAFHQANTRLETDAGGQAADTLVAQYQEPETPEQMEDRIRGEVLMANTKLKDMDHV